MVHPDSENSLSLYILENWNIGTSEAS